MEVHACLLVVSYLLASCHAGLIQKPVLEHPQHVFCKADFVIRADVVSGPETDPEGHYEVFSINITEVFRGLSRGPALNATKLYTPGNMSTERVTALMGSEQALSTFCTAKF